MKTLRLHYITTANVNQYIVQNGCHSFYWFHKIRPPISVPGEIHLGGKKWQKKTNKFKQSSNFEPWNGQYFKQLWGLGPYQSCLYKKCITCYLDHSMHYNLSEEQLESFFFPPSLQNMRQKLEKSYGIIKTSKSCRYIAPAMPNLLSLWRNTITRICEI